MRAAITTGRFALGGVVVGGSIQGWIASQGGTAGGARWRRGSVAHPLLLCRGRAGLGLAPVRGAAARADRRTDWLRFALAGVDARAFRLYERTPGVKRRST